MESVDSRESAVEQYRQGNYKGALPLLTSLADQDDLFALQAVAWINETGAAGQLDLEFAKRCYARAADLGSLDALYRLGRILRKSNDIEEALSAFERRAKQEHLPCISALGMLMIRVAKSNEETETAMKWINDAAEQGHIFARSKVIALRSYENTNVIDIIKLAGKLFIIKIEYYLERRRDKYSHKIL